jgi:hypothetical protein
LGGTDRIWNQGLLTGKNDQPPQKQKTAHRLTGKGGSHGIISDPIHPQKINIKEHYFGFDKTTLSH